MSDPTCARCERPLKHDQAVICSPCGSRLRATLGRTAKLAGEAEVTIARMDRVHRGPGKAEDLGWWKNPNALEPIPLPVNIHASMSYAAAMNELTTWARQCCEIRGIDFALPVAHPLEVLCTFLAGQVDWLRHREEAPEAHDGIENACRSIERLVDRAPDRVVVGRCPCGTWLYAIAGAESVTCLGCGTSYDVEASRQQLRNDLQDRLMTGAQIATMAVMLGIVDSRTRVRNAVKVWAQRARIVPHGSLEGEPAYRFGDTLPLLIDAYARAA